MKNDWQFMMEHAQQCIGIYLAVTAALFAGLFKLLKHPGLRKGWWLAPLAGIASSGAFLWWGYWSRVVYHAVLRELTNEKLREEIGGWQAGLTPLLVAAVGCLAWVMILVVLRGRVSSLGAFDNRVDHE